MKKTQSFEIKQQKPPQESLQRINQMMNIGSPRKPQLQNESQLQQKQVSSHKSKGKESKKPIDINQIVLKARTSKQQESSYYKPKQKLSQTLKNTLKMNSSGRKPSMRTTKIGEKIIKGILKEKFICGICECEYEIKQKAKLSNCDHQYCASCLQHYIIYKVGMFEEVICPQENCDELMNTDSEFFRNLPKDVQQKYKKLHLFYETSKNPNMRLCPNEKCDGVLQMVEGQNPVCQKCDKVFCEKCLFPVHKGQCNQNEVDFFQKNLHYRQCKKCKNVIERTQGCNHMTCRCGHQFCYICGKTWRNNGHLCNENNEGNEGNGDNGQCCEDCGCCGRVCKFIILFPLFLLVCCFLLLKYILMLPLAILCCIFIGATGFTCELICETDNCCLSFLMIIFLPITILIGIGIAFKEIFPDLFSECCEEDLQSMEQCWEDITQ